MGTSRTAFFRGRLSHVLQSRPQSTVARYLSALVVILVATGLRFAMHRLLGESGFAIFLLAIVVAAWLGGLGPCLLAEALSIAIAIYVFPTPPRAAESGIRVIVGLFSFFFAGIVTALLSNANRVSQQLAKSEAADAIRQREELQTTLSCIGEAVIVTDAQGRLTLMNPVAEELTGFGALQSLGCRLSDVFQLQVFEADGSIHICPFSRLLEVCRREAHAASGQLLSRDGAVRPIDYTAAPILNSRGDMTGAVLTFRDETERRSTEQTLRDADRRKDEFLALLAHELRNPLAPIGNALEILRIADGDPALLDEARVMMQRQFEHLVRLVDDLLDVSRIARGKIELRIEDTTLEAVVQRAVEAARPAIDAEGHTLLVELPTAPVLLRVDSVRVAQVITNLLNNAAKYTDAGGRIDVSASCRDHELVLIVRDTGIGIAPEALPEVFDLFMQVDQARARTKPGLGIGLTLVNSIVQMHGGQVVARSAGLGLGSEFIVSLPLLDVEHPEAFAAPSADDRTAASRPRRILVVDDNQDSANSLAQLLRRRRHQVRVVYNGPDALNCVDQERPEIVILDLGMPGMDGFSVAEQIRVRPGGNLVILVALTGWGGADDRRRTCAAGFDFHLVKPLRVDDLEHVLAQDHRDEIPAELPRAQAHDSFFFST